MAHLEEEQKEIGRMRRRCGGGGDGGGRGSDKGKLDEVKINATHQRVPTSPNRLILHVGCEVTTRVRGKRWVGCFK